MVILTKVGGGIFCPKCGIALIDAMLAHTSLSAAQVMTHLCRIISNPRSCKVTANVIVHVVVKTCAIPDHTNNHDKCCSNTSPPSGHTNNICTLGLCFKPSVERCKNFSSGSIP